MSDVCPNCGIDEDGLCWLEDGGNAYCTDRGEVVEPVDAGEDLDAWTCFACTEVNTWAEDECAAFGLSRDTSDYLQDEIAF